MIESSTSTTRDAFSLVTAVSTQPPYVWSIRNRKMFVTSAVVTRPESTSSAEPGSMASSAGGSVARTAADSSGPRPAASSPCRSARSRSQRVHEVGQRRAAREVELFLRRQGPAVGRDGQIRVALGHRGRDHRHRPAPAGPPRAPDRRRELGDGRGLTRSGARHDHPLGILAVVAQVGDHHDDGQDHGIERQGRPCRSWPGSPPGSPVARPAGWRQPAPTAPGSAWSTGRPTVVRNTSARLRRSKAKWLTGPARRAASSTVWASSAAEPFPPARARRTRPPPARTTSTARQPGRP